MSTELTELRAEVVRLTAELRMRDAHITRVTGERTDARRELAEARETIAAYRGLSRGLMTAQGDLAAELAEEVKRREG